MIKRVAHKEHYGNIRIAGDTIFRPSAATAALARGEGSRIIGALPEGALIHV
jgi:hypothetical protein